MEDGTLVEEIVLERWKARFSTADLSFCKNREILSIMMLYCL